MDELWKSITGYENYEVSNLGNVRNVVRGKCLKPYKMSCGYLYVMLCNTQGKKQFRVHRLVAMAFLQKPQGKKHVNHKDEDKSNNIVTNLEWTTALENNHYGTRSQRAAERLSTPVAQYSEDDKLIAIWPSFAEANRNGFSSSLVHKCCNGKARHAYGYRWRYA